ncbi:hypothetical protein PSDVSF_11110 [Pseudodesulfovibrio sediminis]|uniref:Uncharacterized protein n=1 Tax=Pseudodesulfovibrio sediminis TaxID=2810563 RepID=A0ABN6ERW8_9BACT|nr:hypothetical protein PSDVSF_11110 [Pseudodesulfovibrio sediminis]
MHIFNQMFYKNEKRLPKDVELGYVINNESHPCVNVSIIRASEIKISLIGGRYEDTGI